MNAVTDDLPPDELAMRNLEAQRDAINAPERCAARAARWREVAAIAVQRARQVQPR